MGGAYKNRDGDKTNMPTDCPGGTASACTALADVPYGSQAGGYRFMIRKDIAR